MESALYYVTIALGFSIVVNLILKRFGISQIIGYILTGVTVAYGFDLRHMADSHTLEIIAEFGVVFLMFTIGLEVSLQRLSTMKTDVFFNGSFQVILSAVIFFAIAYGILSVSLATAIIISMALSLSSTAVVLSYLKSTKEIARPYGQKATGILIFQDLAVIPILILIGFLSSDGKDIGDVLIQTAISAVVIVGSLFIVGKRVMTWLLHFSSTSEVDELFMGSVLVIVVASSLLASYAGFTYSLGAFVAGMIIAETRYHHKVESDIAPFKDLLLGTFFVTVGMKIDLGLFVQHMDDVIAILFAVLAVKAIVIFGVVRMKSQSKVAFKTAIALSQVGEFSFAIFALAGNQELIPSELSQILVLVVVLSIIATPFILANLSRISGYFFKDVSVTETFAMLPGRNHHIIVCGYGVVGKFVAKELRASGVDYVVADNSYKHVQEALRDGQEVYFGDMSKTAILDKLCTKDSVSVIITLDNLEKKRLICEAIIRYAPEVKLVVKVVSLEEKRALRGLPISITIDGKKEVASRLVSEAVTCEL
ncbi:Kef-type potassium/proton antiporter, CPA2 family [Sulfuricurvum kujiense DSM 16994]|uniref:Kef-type potassium/proton antiporter, CPA2 family n=1 Tax=Sulfuricurvum kujiense (strain ATCC BAA-921 / DSM 16994 / JCM 11577 / YK-1) TaxID=709032 RepID=E4TZE4_SULKY|nr:cation:proton antiporter [Sulfuricurvum kujiense]ADR35171.1 Kef-type potassium/proton antiporter, CPA2 family [Sulfuricurvum kujiense DSM 16994]